jgi:hypothetical protein
MLLDHLVDARKQGRRHIYKGDGLVSFVPRPDSRTATNHRIILFNVTLFHSNNPGAAHLALLNEFNKSNV